MKILSVLLAIIGSSTVGMDAFLHHAGDAYFAPSSLDALNQATRYSMLYIPFIFVLALYAFQYQQRLLLWIAWLFFGSLLCFSVPIYLKYLLNCHWFDFLPPIGGTGLIATWLLLAYFAGRMRLNFVKL